MEPIAEGSIAEGIAKVLGAYPPNLIDFCTCEGIDANNQPINRKSSFYNETVWAWTKWEGSFYARDIIAYIWYKNERIDSTANNWVKKGQAVYEFQEDHINNYLHYNWSTWFYPSRAIGQWKVEFYYNLKLKGTVEFTTMIKNTDTALLSQRIKNTSFFDYTFYHDFVVWTPSANWGDTPDTAVTIPAGQSQSVGAYFSNPFIPHGTWVNVTGRVKDAQGNILDTITIYSVMGYIS